MTFQIGKRYTPEEMGLGRFTRGAPMKRKLKSDLWVTELAWCEYQRIRIEELERCSPTES